MTSKQTSLMRQLAIQTNRMRPLMNGLMRIQLNRCHADFLRANPRRKFKWQQESDQSHGKPYICSFENCPGIAVWISDVDGDPVFQYHLFHLAFCRRFLSLAYPSQRKRGFLNPSPEKMQKKDPEESNLLSPICSVLTNQA